MSWMAFWNILNETILVAAQPVSTGRFFASYKLFKPLLIGILLIVRAVFREATGMPAGELSAAKRAIPGGFAGSRLGLLLSLSKTA